MMPFFRAPNVARLRPPFHLAPDSSKRKGAVFLSPQSPGDASAHVSGGSHCVSKCPACSRPFVTSLDQAWSWDLKSSCLSLLSHTVALSRPQISPQCPEAQTSVQIVCGGVGGAVQSHTPQPNLLKEFSMTISPQTHNKLEAPSSVITAPGCGTPSGTPQ